MNYREPMTAKPLTSPFHCAVKGWDAKRKKNCGGLMSQCYDSVLQTATLCYMVIATFSCLVIVKHETSNKLPRATKASKTQWN